MEGRGLRVREFTDQEFARAESEFFGLVRELTEYSLDFLMVTGELFLSYKGPGLGPAVTGRRGRGHPCAGLHGADLGDGRLPRTGDEARRYGESVSRKTRTPA